MDYKKTGYSIVTIAVLFLILVFETSALAQVSVTCDNADEEAGVFYSKGTKDLYTGDVICYYKSGVKASEGKIKNGKREDLWITYWDGSGKKDEINYVNGISEGPFVTYFKGGKVSSKGTYEKGNFNGPHESYFITGKTERRSVYAHGLLEGKVYSYNENGVLIHEQSFKHGEEDGVQYTFNDKGIKIMEIGYKDGDEFKDGTYALWNGEGTPTNLSHYTMGIKTGVWKTWYDNGVLSSVCEYDKKGNIKGKKETYFKNGNLETRATYVNNILNGAFVEFYENGKPKSKGAYRNGERSGEWMEWDPDNHFVKKIY
jgi:antitoxin component YwqK of YwqJK toxin-antitoxin module